MTIRTPRCLLLACICVSALAGCVNGPTYAPERQAGYVFVYLKSGPNSGQGTKEARQEMFKGHMGNINRLATEKKLVIAGPFGKPRDKTWRGIFVLDVRTIAEAQGLAATDPGVQAGEFVAECRRMTGSPLLRTSLDLEGELQAARKANPIEPPPEIRGYVMVTTSNTARARKALAKSKIVGRVIWDGRFIDDGEAGVFVMDATDAAVVAAEIQRIDPGAGETDGWFSTAALAKLPEEAAR